MPRGLEIYILRSADRNLVVAQRTYRPTFAPERWMGLLARPRLGPGEALWLNPCGGIHTWGMRCEIDVLFLDADGQVLRVAREVRPWRLVWAPRGTRSVVELPAGAAAPLQAGDRLELEPGGE